MDEFLEKYQALIEQRKKASQATEEKRSLFERNHHVIDESFHHQLESYQNHIQSIEKLFKTDLDKLKEVFDFMMKDTQKTFIETNQQLEEDLNTAESTKQNIYEVTFKEDEKIDITYQSIYDQENNAQIEHIETIEEDIKRFSLEHQTLQKELETSTDNHKNELVKDFEEKQVSFDKAFKLLSSEASQKKSGLLSKKQVILDEYALKLRELEDTYHQGLKPFIEEIGSKRLEHTKRKSDIENEYASQKAKLERYLNEAKKIDDEETISKYQKELKELELNSKIVLDEEYKRLDNELAPSLQKQKAYNDDFQMRFFKVKKAFLTELVQVLTDLEKVKTDEMLELDDLNLSFNIDEKTYKAGLELNHIDFTIQTLNYDQKKFEQTLYKDKEKALLGPAFDKEILKAKETLQEGHATQEKKRQEADYHLEYEKKLFDLKRTHVASVKSLKQRFLEAYYSHDKSLLGLRLNRQKHDALMMRHETIKRHYTKFSENYTALSSIWLDPWVEPLRDLHSIELENARKYLRNIKEKAKHDHQSMLEAIERIYHEEIGPLNAALKEEEAFRDSLIEKAEMAYKKQKNTMVLKGEKNPKKQDKLQDLMHQDHQKQLKKINRQFESKVSELIKLIQHTEESYKNSKEEAETLLNHVLDQTDVRLKEMQILLDQERSLFKDGQTYLVKSSGLFQWFQDKRLEDHDDLKESLNHSFLQKNAAAMISLLESFYEKLTKLDDQEDQTEENYISQLKILEENYEQKLKELSSDHQAYLDQNHQEIASQMKSGEENRLNLQKEYEKQIKDLDKGMEAERQKYFLEKSTIESNLELVIKQLTEDTSKNKASKENRKDEKLHLYHNQSQALLEALENDAIHTLQVRHLRDTESYLEKLQSMSMISEGS